MALRKHIDGEYKCLICRIGFPDFDQLATHSHKSGHRLKTGCYRSRGDVSWKNRWVFEK